jgi:formiminoglutamase/agmatinase
MNEPILSKELINLGLKGREWHEKPLDPKDKIFSQLICSPKDISKADLGIVGIPFDLAVISRKGARFAPNKIREALANLKPFSLKSKRISLKIVDFGDLKLDKMEIDEAHAKIEEAATLIHQKTLPIFLGGDNSITYPIVKPLLKRKEKIGVISMDAHLDLRELINPPTSGSPYHLLYEAGLAKLVVIGLQEFHNSEYYLKKAAKLGVDYFSDGWVRKNGEKAFKLAYELMIDKGIDKIYVSFDLDALNQAYMPGVSAPNSSGLEPWNFFEIAREAGKTKEVIGTEFVELAPSLDYTYTLSCRICAEGIMNFIFGVEERC